MKSIIALYNKVSVVLEGVRGQQLMIWDEAGGSKKICGPSLGHSQLIPGMADFSQGFLQQSVGGVKKKNEPMVTNLP